MDEFVEEARFADTGLADEGHDSAMAVPCLLQRPSKLFHLALAPNKPTESTGGRRLDARPHRPRTRQLVDPHRLAQALYGDRTKRLHLDVAFGEPEGLASEE